MRPSHLLIFVALVHYVRWRTIRDHAKSGTWGTNETEFDTATGRRFLLRGTFIWERYVWKGGAYLVVEIMPPTSFLWCLIVIVVLMMVLLVADASGVAFDLSSCQFCHPSNAAANFVTKASRRWTPPSEPFPRSALSSRHAAERLSTALRNIRHQVVAAAPFHEAVFLPSRECDPIILVTCCHDRHSRDFTLTSAHLKRQRSTRFPSPCFFTFPFFFRFLCVTPPHHNTAT